MTEGGDQHRRRRSTGSVELFYARARRADYARLEQAVVETTPGAGGLVFAPVLGDGERDDPALRGAVTGLSLRHDRGAVARAALEGIACGVRARLNTLGRTSTPATELRVSGGGAGMAVWNQIKADVTGIPVVRVAGDSTAAGAAMLAGLGAGSTVMPPRRSRPATGRSDGPNPIPLIARSTTTCTSATRP